MTGLTGLVYELVWIRLLILAFGSTQFAITTVLVTFMAGLALGSLIFGRVVDRRPVPLMVYALIEVALGLYCVLSPEVFLIVRDLYVSFSGGGAGMEYAGFEFTQFILSFSALIIPTTLMGGTLPVLVKYLASSSGRVGFHTAIPYAVNTIGAVIGCLAAGFFLLYFLGLKTTLYTAGAVDILVGVLIFIIFRSGQRASALSAAAGPSSVHTLAAEEPSEGVWNLNLMIMASFALSGFCSLAYEVLWTRVFALVLGSSVYAFTVMLATFLAGIGLGSILFASLVDRLKRPLVWFGILEAVIGFTSLFSIFIYKELPFIFYNLKAAFAQKFLFFHILQFALCATIMLIPTLSMGAIFPLVGRIYTKELKTVGRNIGELYFFNTAGAIFGSFVGGFILIPLYGVQTGVVITTALNIMIAVVILNFTDMRLAFRGAVTVSLLAVFSVAALSLPPWERTVMTTGFYVNAVEKKDVDFIRKGEGAERLLYYREGINAVITVRERHENNKTIRTYQANGKQEAFSINGRPPEGWSVLGHIPILLHKGVPGEALLVGLGAGVTLGAMEYYPLKNLDVIEIEKAVVEAAGFFKEANNNALSDPRVKLHIADGRSFLFAGKKKYDVIVSAVSDPWITGVANLFTYEYFNALSKSLKDDGTVALWFQNYRTTPEELKIGLNTFAAAFPYLSIWFHYTDALDLVVIGTKRPQKIDMKDLRGWFADAEVKRGLSLVGINRPVDLFGLFLIGNTDLRRYTGVTPLNTDERPLIEFTLPRHLYMDLTSGVRNVEEILANVREITPSLLIPEEDKEGFYLSLGKSFNKYSFRLPEAYRVFKEVLKINPENREAAYLAESLKKELNY
ncbi:MAG: fused MFS/spermidine synthase [Thermodesulfobacteriota bacterium]